MTILLFSPSTGFITVWPVLSSVFTLRTDYSRLGCKSGWNPILRFSPMWEPTRKTGIGNVFFKKQPNGFSHHNPNLVLKVLNKFGSLVPLVLLFTWGCCYWLFLLFFSLGATTLLLLLLLFSSYCYYSSLYCHYSFPITLFLFLLLLLFSHGVALLL